MNKEQIIEKLDEVISNTKNVDESTEEGYFNKITVPLVALQNFLREQMQAETAENISIIIDNLESDEDIADSDLMLIRLWLVGDAASYVEMENDYQGWLKELNRLLGVISQLKGKELSLENMYRFSGITRDAIRVMGDIIFFKQQEERINKFEKASKYLNSENKRIVAKVLRQKLNADQM